MKIDKGHSIMTTSVGSIFSIILFIIVGMYALQKTNIMIMKTDDYVMTSTQDSFFDLDYKFGFEQGFNIAVAFTAFDDEKENILRPEIGRIVYRQYKWGFEANDRYKLTQDYLPTHTCTKQELGIDQQSENSFYPLKDEGYFQTMKGYQKKFVCIDKEQLYLKGDFDSEKARLI